MGCGEGQGSPVVRGVAGQRAVSHEGGGAAAIQIDGVDHSVPLQEVRQLPKIHPAQTIQKSTLACSEASQLAAMTTRGQHQLSPSLLGLSVQLDHNQSTIRIMAHRRPRRHHVHEGLKGPYENGRGGRGTWWGGVGEGEGELGGVGGGDGEKERKRRRSRGME